MQVRPEFWRNRRVLLTGHTGFKGSWLSLWLQSLGAQLRGLALEAPTKPSLFDVANVAIGMDHCIADIRDRTAVHSLVHAFRPEVVIHLAAQPLVRHSYREPVETYETNVMGTVHLLEAARNVGSVRAIVNVTTDKCYHNREWAWGYRESDRLGGHDPYSNSKACAELVSAAYRDSFLMKAGIPLATARAGNVIGGGDWAADRLVPDFFRAVDAGETLAVRSPGSTRPWQHVLEPLSGYLLLAERLTAPDGMESAQGWNFGPEDEDAKPVRWILDYLSARMPSRGWKQSGADVLHEAGYLKLDSTLARQRLNWRAKWELPNALDMTLEWHKAWRAGADMRNICLDQIARHQMAAHP